MNRLFSHDAEKRIFIECPKEKRSSDHRRSRRRRWIIFASILMQKIILFFAEPLASIGSMLETLLNLLSNNQGIKKLLINLLKGKVEMPDKSSATFASVVGHIDTRVDLDVKIEPGSMRYCPLLCIMASKLSYENEAFAHRIIKDHWKMEFLGFYNFWNEYEEQYSTQAIMFFDTHTDPNIVVVAFRGTELFNPYDWQTDVDISWYKIQNIGKVHSGFMKALGQPKNKVWPQKTPSGPPLAYYSIREKLKEKLRNTKNAKFILTGHSMGGALAILFVALLELHDETWLMEKLEGVYTFGQPRVGDEKFGEYMKEKLRWHGVKYFRYVYSNDIVPRLPYDDKTFMFKHFGTCIFFNSCYKGKIVLEEPDKNYSMFWVISKILNATWELIRGFIIQYTNGPDYREGWFLMMFRVIGLLVPGLPDHFLQDYVNAIRLGSMPTQLQIQQLMDERLEVD